MEKLHLLTLFMILASIEVSANTWVGSKYQIECTMCSACDNPCANPSPPPPSPSPPPPPRTPSPPPPSTPSTICPPPPSNPYYNSPPPPYQPTYSYSPPPPGGVIGGYYPPGPYKGYPVPPPPHPIMPYFPFYYYSPPPPSLSKSAQLTASSVVYTIALLLSFLCLV